MVTWVWETLRLFQSLYIIHAFICVTACARDSPRPRCTMQCFAGEPDHGTPSRRWQWELLGQEAAGSFVIQQAGGR